MQRWTCCPFCCRLTRTVLARTLFENIGDLSIKHTPNKHTVLTKVLHVSTNSSEHTKIQPNLTVEQWHAALLAKTPISSAANAQNVMARQAEWETHHVLAILTKIARIVKELANSVPG